MCFNSWQKRLVGKSYLSLTEICDASATQSKFGCRRIKITFTSRPHAYWNNRLGQKHCCPLRVFEISYWLNCLVNRMHVLEWKYTHRILSSPYNCVVSEINKSNFCNHMASLEMQRLPTRTFFEQRANVSTHWSMKASYLHKTQIRDALCWSG